MIRSQLLLVHNSPAQGGVDLLQPRQHQLHLVAVLDVAGQRIVLQVDGHQFAVVRQALQNAELGDVVGVGLCGKRERELWNLYWT